MTDVINFTDDKDQRGHFDVDYSFGIDGPLDTFDSSSANFQLISSDQKAASMYATAAVPEPATMLLFGTGIACVAGVVRKREK